MPASKITERLWLGDVDDARKRELEPLARRRTHAAQEEEEEEAGHGGEDGGGRGQLEADGG